MPIVTATDVVEIIEPKRGGPSGPRKPPRGFGGGGGNGGGSGDSPARQRAYVTGMTVALGGILMFFMALVSAYIVRKGAGADWRSLIVPKILWANTAILIISSFTLSRSRRDFLRDDLPNFRHWWYVTTALGFLFLIGQLIAWRQLANAGVYLASNPSSSFFYVFTAAHGLHILGGLGALLAVAFHKGRRLTLATSSNVVAMYWHFMDGLWVFLFLLLTLGR
jgi:cytochrome c oxidase subunit III